MFKPILIGQAEAISLRSDEVQQMADNEGMYLCGDSNQPDATVPIVSMGGRLYSMEIDTELDPDRFLESLTISGPFLKD